MKGLITEELPAETEITDSFFVLVRDLNALFILSTLGEGQV